MFKKTMVNKLLLLLFLFILASSLPVFMSFRLPGPNKHDSTAVFSTDEDLPDNDLLGPVPGKDTSSGSESSDDDSTVSGSSGPEFEATEIVFLDAEGTGDFATLEEAFLQVTSGAMIMLSKGTYYLESSLEVNKSISLIGAGVGKTIITSDVGGDSIIVFSGTGKFLADSISFKYEGEENSDVLEITSGAAFINRCSFSGGNDAYPEDDENWGIGIYIHEKAECTVTDSICENNDFSGIDVDDYAKATLVNNIIKNNLLGINYYCEQGGGAAINNECTSNIHDGIQIQYGSNPVIEGNYVHDNLRTGIAYYDDSGGFAMNNKVENNGEDGIVIADSSNPSIMYNTIKGHKGYTGLGFWTNSSGYAIGNTCTGNGWGIYVEGTAKPFIGDNSTSGNTESDFIDDRDA